MDPLEIAVIVVCFTIAAFALAIVFGKAARLGHGDERSKPRMKEIESIDVERV